MKNVSMFTFSALSAAVIFMSGCGKTDTTTTAAPNCDSSLTTLSGTITSNKTLTAGTNYGLDGKVVVASGVTLTIEPGVKIAGCTGASFLLIDKGAKIDANGTQASPIVFTSQKELLGNSTAGAKGEWGTLAILGNAPIHGGTATYEASTETFGGNDANDSSGVLNYVVIKHSGYEVEVDKELNGLSLAGVGNGTTISNIAILGGADDGIEIWGGTVNINGLYIRNASDDSLDTDLGYRGTITNVAAVQVTVDKTDYNSAGMEFGNDHDNYSVNDSNATLPTIVNGYFDVIAGGLYMKNDAGAVFTNVTINRTSPGSDTNSSKYGVITHRTIDVAATNALTIDNGTLNLFDDRTTKIYFSDRNAKLDSTTGAADTADGFWKLTMPTSSASATKGVAVTGNTTGTLNLDGSAASNTSGTAAVPTAGVASGNISGIWKGNAGDNNLPTIW